MIVLWLSACTGTDTPPAPVVESPEALVERLDAPGAYHVGHIGEDLTWSEPGVQDTPRTLRLSTWYPTEATTGDPVAYLFGSVPADGVLGNAPVATGSHPVAVFSHGHQAYAEAASFLMEHLASHGFVVLAPDHTDNTTFDGDSRTTEIYWQRPLDISAVIDHALAPPAGHPLQGATTDEVVVLGHSFGGYTIHAVGGAAYTIDDIVAACLDGTDTSAFCSTMDEDQAARFEGGQLADPRVRGLISMAPGDHRLFTDGLAEVAVPVVLLTGGEDGQVGDAAEIWADLDDPDDVRVHVPTAGHNAFTDFSGALDPGEVIDPEEGWRITRVYTTAAALWRATDDPSVAPVLDGTAAVSDLAELTAR